MRRALGILLAVMMLAAGLGMAGAEEAQAAAANAAEARETGTGEEANAAETVKSAAAGTQAPDYVMEGYDAESANHIWETNLFFQRMQEDTGITFEYRQYSTADSWAARKEAILQGEDLPDMLFKAGLTDGETRAMAEAGILIDLKPYLAEYAPDLWKILETHPEYLDAITLQDGTIRALPCINELPANNFMWINQTWLNTLHLEMPTTTEELTEVLRAFRSQDPNRNGKADEVPLSTLGMWDLRFLAHGYGIVDNDYYLSSENGQVRSCLTGEDNRAFLTWLHQLWEENLLSHTSFSTVDSLRQVTDSNAAMVYGMFLSSSPLTVISSDSMSQYTAMAPLSFGGNRVYRELLGPVTRGTFALTSACREPEKLIAWVNRLYTEEGGILLQVGREGEEYEWIEEDSWEWIADMQTVANDVLPNSTLSDGGIAPGFITLDFQAKYHETRTREMIAAMAGAEEYAVLPLPQVMLSQADADRLAELQANIAPYAEKKMAEFVVGDAPLDDANWEEFTRGVTDRGLEEVIALWQKYMK